MDSLASKILKLEADLLSKDSEILSLRKEISLLKTALFGKKSEKLSSKELEDAKQLILPNLFNEAESHIDAVPDSSDDEEESIKLESSNVKQKPGRKKLPSSLPREEKIHDLEESAKICHCGEEMVKMGEEISEELDYIPAKIRVIKHIRNKYSCRSCYENVQIAEAPLKIIDKGIASPGLLANILVSKFADHLPFYRQSQIFKRFDISISDRSLCSWSIKSADLLSPLINALKSDILSSNYACSDETTLNVLNEAQATNYMWVHHSGSRDNRAVIFDYHKNRSGTHAVDFMKGFEGIHQCDGYSGYNNLYNDGKIIRAGCMDHARRKFFNVYVSNNKQAGLAKDVLRILKQVYKIESDAKKEKLSLDQLYKQRQKISRKILSDLHKMLLTKKDKIPPKSDLYQAVTYMLNQWQHLILYLDHPHIRIANDDAERIIKPFALGRKNWLFNKTKSGAKASANIYSIIATCKDNNVNPYQYLKYVLPKLKLIKKEKTNSYDISQLLPYNIDQKLLKEAD